MNKQLLIALLALILLSCNNKKEEKNNTTTPTTQPEKTDLPYSTGDEFDILVVGENIEENKDLQMLLDSMLMQEIPILPQPEKLFIPTYLNLFEFDQNYMKYRNILILKSGSTDSLMNKFEKHKMPENLISEEQQKLKNYIFIENLWAQPQLVVYLTGPDPIKLEDQIIEESDRFVAQFDDFSKERIKTLLYNMGENTTISSELYMNHKIGLRIPKKYRIAKNYKQKSADPEMEGLNLDRLLWIRDEQGLPDINILTYSHKLTDSSQLAPEKLMLLKDEVTKAVVDGGNEGSYIAAERRVPFKLSRKTINGLKVIEIRGLFQTVGDDMGGPFIYYIIPDWKNKKVYYIDAFVFAPNMAKKLPMQTLEVIVSTLKIGK